MGDYAPILLSRLIHGQAVTFAQLERLPDDLRGLALKVIGQGSNPAGREATLRAGLLAAGDLDLLSAIESADPSVELDTVTAGGWPIRSFAEAYEPREPLVYALSGVLPKSGLAMFYSLPKKLKSFAVTYTALCIAIGKAAFPTPDGKGGIATTQASVLWLDFENGSRLILERLEAFGRAMAIPKDAPFHFSSGHYLDASDLASVGGLALEIKRLGVGVCVLDNFGQVVGGLDLNSPDMARVMGNLRRLVDETGVLLVAIHHKSKMAGRYQEAQSEISGHGSLVAALDVGIEVQRDGINSPNITLRPTVNRLAPFDPIFATFAYSHKDGTKELAQANFFALPSSEFGAEKIRAAILETVESTPGLSQNKLAGAVVDALPGVSSSSVRIEINALEHAGKLKTKAGKNNAFLYYIGEAE